MKVSSIIYVIIVIIQIYVLLIASGLWIMIWPPILFAIIFIPLTRITYILVKKHEDKKLAE